MTGPTILWGVAANEFGVVHHESIVREDLADGQMRAWKESELTFEPADAYASEHPAPMPMKWHHGEDIGRIVALRRRAGQLTAVAESELEPDDLQGLVDEYGDLKWSTSTFPGRRAPLRINEISLTPEPASIGLSEVSWYKPGVSKGDLPRIVKEDLDRARKTAFRSRDVLRVYDVEANTTDDFIRSAGDWNPREIFYSGSPGTFLSVNGRPVRRGR
jgi:hypothetical protein